MRTNDAEAAFRQISALVATMPDLTERDGDVLESRIPSDTLKWLGRLFPVVERISGAMDAISLRIAADNLNGVLSDRNAEKVCTIAYRALAIAEDRAPSAVQGSFIPVGHEFDAFSQIGKILETAKTDVLLVDPYMDSSIVTDFAVLAPEGVQIRMLTDEAGVKDSLVPAVGRWLAQNASRPLEARLATARTLHDRAILIDYADAWILTQSFKDFAKRSPGSIARMDEDAARLKIAAYEALFGGAMPTHSCD